MHDIDRTLNEFGAGEMGLGEMGETGFELGNAEAAVSGEDAHTMSHDQAGATTAPGTRLPTTRPTPTASQAAGSAAADPAPRRRPQSGGRHQVPRERMIGSGIASSLVHEVGHQGAALLDLIPSLQPLLQQRISAAGADRRAWECWKRWISEIIADLWSVARLGATATVGLMAVVGLPRAFVFRVNMDDPHPAPWIRVKLSCAMGAML